MAIGATKWLTVCLHYNEPWEEFLTKAVKPYIDVVMQTGVAECFFFERSHDRGPNIRLWFKSAEYLLNHMLKPNLQEHFQHYFDAKPSFLLVPSFSEELPISQRWHPNNSVQFIEGTDVLPFRSVLEMSILTKQYQAASLLVLSALKHGNGKWSQNQQTSTAIKLHLALIYATGMTLIEAIGFSTWAYHDWKARYHQRAGIQQRTEEHDSTDLNFHKFYELQRNDILPYQAAIWELLKNYSKVEDPSFVEWIHTNSNASVEIGLALDAGKLVSLPTKGAPPADPAWSFYADFLCKTNNRLGLFRKNEGYIYYALAHGLQYIANGSMQLAAFEHI